MRKYTYILQTHNPDKKYVVDNIVENISADIVDNIARKSTLSTMLWRDQAGWFRDAIQRRKWMLIIVTRSID